MRHTVHIFALNANSLADDLKRNSDHVIAKVSSWLCKSDIKVADREFGLRLVNEICSRDLPETCNDDYFWALCWICEALCERVELPVLTDFCGLDFLAASRIWQVLSRASPPFLVPRSNTFPPGVGFLACESMDDAMLELARFDPGDRADDFADALRRQTGAPRRPTDQATEWARYARTQFVDLVESLVEDGLDLLAVTVTS